MNLHRCAILALMAIYMAGLAHSATLTVGGANGNYASIQSAVYDAKPGDSIQVSPGIYKENVYVDKNIALMGVGDSLPIVDAGGKGAALTLSADGITLKGIHVINSTGGGIEVYSSNNIIAANYASNNQYGIYLSNASSNNISGNIASDNVYVGIEVDKSSGNIIRNNVANNNSAARHSSTKSSGYGIYLYNSSYNIISGTRAEDNQLDALNIFNSQNNSLVDNFASGNKGGIYLYRSNGSIIDNNLMVGNLATGVFVEESFYCTIENNTVEDNKITGLNLWKSRNNTLRNNRMIGNRYNFDADGPNDIDTSNLIDGMKIYYLVGESNQVIDRASNAGAVYCTNCNNITVKCLDLRANDVGIYFHNTSNSLVWYNRIADVEGGIYLDNSKHNAIIGNVIRNCKDNCIFVGFSSDGNLIRCNNVSNSLKSGIAIQDSWINTLKSNTAANNSLYGIALYDSSKNTVTGNTVKDNLVPDIFINGTSEGNYISDNKIIRSSNFTAYDKIVRSLNYSASNNVYIGNDYVNFDIGCKTIDPCCDIANPCDSNISKFCTDGASSGLCTGKTILHPFSLSG